MVEKKWPVLDCLQYILYYCHFLEKQTVVFVGILLGMDV